MPNNQWSSDDHINELVKGGNIEAAVKALYEAIVSAAQKGEFGRAELLRERLYEVDAMALTEIVKSGEIIEQEKSRSINLNHREVWSALYGKLTQAEANAFFYALEERQIDTDQTAIIQGHVPEGLLFINRGRAKIVWKDGATEVFLKTLNAGDVAGHDTFFEISVATTSLIALTPLNYSLLSKENTRSWEQSEPNLLYRLKEYCRQLERPCDLVKKKGVERRKHQRLKLSGKIKVQILNSTGTALGNPFKGDLLNISEGGLGFQIMVSNQKAAAMLLGRELQLTFLVEKDTIAYRCEVSGTVTSVTDLLLNEFGIHVRFNHSPSNIRVSLDSGRKLS
jgi:hypothetical protein